MARADEAAVAAAKGKSAMPQRGAGSTKGAAPWHKQKPRNPYPFAPRGSVATDTAAAAAPLDEDDEPDDDHEEPRHVQETLDPYRSSPKDEEWVECLCPVARHHSGRNCWRLVRYNYEQPDPRPLCQDCALQWCNGSCICDCGACEVPEPPTPHAFEITPYDALLVLCPFLCLYVADATHHAPADAAHTTKYEDPFVSWLPSFSLLLSVILLVTLLFLFAAKLFQKTKKKKEVKDATTQCTLPLAVTYVAPNTGMCYHIRKRCVAHHAKEIRELRPCKLCCP